MDANRKMLKSEVGLRREQEEEILQRFYAIRGDTRTPDERDADLKRCQTYTQGEAERIIASIMSDPLPCFIGERSDGTLERTSKEEIIRQIREQIRE